jgi:hypothetical protein
MNITLSWVPPFPLILLSLVISFVSSYLKNKLDRIIVTAIVSVCVCWRNLPEMSSSWNALTYFVSLHLFFPLGFKKEWPHNLGAVFPVTNNGLANSLDDCSPRFSSSLSHAPRLAGWESLCSGLWLCLCLTSDLKHCAEAICCASGIEDGVSNEFYKCVQMGQSRGG